MLRFRSLKVPGSNPGEDIFWSWKYVVVLAFLALTRQCGWSCYRHASEALFTVLYAAASVSLFTLPVYVVICAGKQYLQGIVGMLCMQG